MLVDKEHNTLSDHCRTSVKTSSDVYQMSINCLSKIYQITIEHDINRTAIKSLLSVTIDQFVTTEGIIKTY